MTPYLILLALAVVVGLLAPMDLTAPFPAPMQAIVWGPIIQAVAPALVSSMAGLFGQSMANRANDRAARTQANANREALDFEQMQEQRRQDEWERTMAMNQDMWQSEVAREQRNADRLFTEDVLRDRRLDPYRQAGRAALDDLNTRRMGSMRDLMPVGRV